MASLHRWILARRLGLYTFGGKLAPQTKRDLNKMLDRRITWRVLSNALSAAHQQSARTASEQHVHALAGLVTIARYLVNHGSSRMSMNHDVRNSIDLELYMLELANLPSIALECPRVVVHLLLDGMRQLQPGLALVWKEKTAEEAVRRELIVRSGQVYQRHMHPDYTGCDELFYMGPLYEVDTQLEKAKKILGMT